MPMLNSEEIENYKNDGAVFLRKKFDISWVEKLKIGIKKDIKNPSPRFKSHTIEKNIPSYLEDYWTWIAFLSLKISYLTPLFRK